MLLRVIAGAYKNSNHGLKTIVGIACSKDRGSTLTQQGSRRQCMGEGHVEGIQDLYRPPRVIRRGWPGPSNNSHSVRVLNAALDSHSMLDLQQVVSTCFAKLLSESYMCGKHAKRIWASHVGGKIKSVKLAMCHHLGVFIRWLHLAKRRKADLCISWLIILAKLYEGTEGCVSSNY